MFLLAHLAAGYLAGRLWNVLVRRHPINLLLATFGGILPDLIDKPLSFTPGWDSGRSLAHSLLFLGLLMLASLRYRALVPVWLGVATHLVLDDPSVYMETLFWPLLGAHFTPDDDMSFSAIVRHLSKHRTSVSEVMGGIVFLGVGAQHAWSKMRSRVTRFATRPVQHGRPVEASTE